MTYLITKFLITAAVVVLVAEVAKRNTIAASILASLPIISILAMIWLYLDTDDVTPVMNLATGIFWMVIPSLVLFITLPALLARQIPFYPALALSSLATIIAYFSMLSLLEKLGIKPDPF